MRCAMGSVSLKHIGGAAVIVGALTLSHMLPSRGAQPLRHDHTRTWSYIKRPHRAATSFESRLGEVASLVAGRPVEVRCEDFSDGTPNEPGGVVEFDGKTPADYARIRPDVCSTLVHFVRAPDGATPDVAEAVTILAHESYHLRGIRNEAAAQCAAMSAVPRVAHALAPGETVGSVLAALEYRYGYPRMPAAYRSRTCVLEQTP
jgi:hypothetical protein